MEVRLATGAAARATGPRDGPAVVCVNGGASREAAGTWSASLDWLVARLAPRFPGLGFLEVRYRVKSWRRLEPCVEDARAAIRHAVAGGGRCLLVGYSMGGAVAVGAAAEPAVEAVVGLAPWFPDRLDLAPLAGRRLTVLHGSLDRPLPGIPGVTPAASRRGFERARALGVEGEYALIPGAVHGIAIRGPRGTPLPLPRAGRWAELVARELERFQASAA